MPLPTYLPKSTKVDELALVGAARSLVARARAIKLTAQESSLTEENVVWIRKLALQARIDAESVLASLEVPND